jgi:alkylated DNA repair dioxygenase AlkB
MNGRQLELFEPTSENSSVTRDFAGIPGLTYCLNFLKVSEQARILADVDSLEWLGDLSRRVQHYGFRYDYRARRVAPDMYVGPLPEFAMEVGSKLLSAGLVPELPDQVIVNEYLPGQGIAAHIDCEPCFKDFIVTISLGSVYEMEFTHALSGEVKGIDLELGSAVVLSGPARFNWKHAIKSRRTDSGRIRSRRVSLTFRKVLLEKT